MDWTKHSGTPVPIREVQNEWRYLLNSIYNYNLATKLNLHPVLNSNWWRIGNRWLSERTLKKELKLEPAGELPLRTPLYLDQIDIAFVRRVRKTAEFWRSLHELEKARGAGDPGRWQTIYVTHLQFLSDQLAEYLVASGKHKLVGKPVRRSIVASAFGVSHLAGPVVTLAAHHWGQPLRSAIEYGTAAMGLGDTVAVAIHGIFELCPGIGEKVIRSKRFKNFVAEVGEAGGIPLEIRGLRAGGRPPSS